METGCSPGTDSLMRGACILETKSSPPWSAWFASLHNYPLAASTWQTHLLSRAALPVCDSLTRVRTESALISSRPIFFLTTSGGGVLAYAVVHRAEGSADVSSVGAFLPLPHPHGKVAAPQHCRRIGRGTPQHQVRGSSWSDRRRCFDL